MAKRLESIEEFEMEENPQTTFNLDNVDDLIEEGVVENVC